MIRIQRSALLPYSNEKIFTLVNDIAAYPEYMDGCVGATILSSTDDTLEARLELRKGGITQSFSTRNTLEKPQKIIMSLLEGPFETFHGEWNFKALASEACKVSLDIHFHIQPSAIYSHAAQKASEKLFESVAGNLVNSLCQRANKLYG